MRHVTPDFRITVIDVVEPGEVFVDPADEKRYTATADILNRYKSGYLVIVEDPPE